MNEVIRTHRKRRKGERGNRRCKGGKQEHMGTERACGED